MQIVNFNRCGHGKLQYSSVLLKLRYRRRWPWPQNAIFFLKKLIINKAIELVISTKTQHPESSLLFSLNIWVFFCVLKISERETKWNSKRPNEIWNKGASGVFKLFLMCLAEEGCPLGWSLNRLADTDWGILRPECQRTIVASAWIQKHRSQAEATFGC